MKIERNLQLSETRTSFVPPLGGIYPREIPEAAPVDAAGQKRILIQGSDRTESSVYTANSWQIHSSAGGTASTTLHSI